VLDGRGSVHACTALEVDKKHVLLRVDETTVQPAPAGRLKLVQSITKGKSFDFILQKAVELGGMEVVPLLADRVVARPDERDFVDKVEKWNHVAIEAIKQCGAPWLPVISKPMSVRDALAADAETELRLVGALTERTLHPAECFANFREAGGHAPESVSI